MVNSEAPQRADAALVLGGDYHGRRVLKGAELFSKGYVPKVLVSGSGPIYGMHESELAIQLAVRRGYPQDAFIPLQHEAVSTEDEIRSVVESLRTMRIRKLLLVTSPSHTGRATRVARQLLPGIEIHSIAAEDPTWQNGYWWTNREGRKAWLFEAMKSIAYSLDL